MRSYLKHFIFQVSINFFCEKHGKSSRDSHFSMVSKFVLSKSLETILKSSQDVAYAIVEGQNKANENKKLLGKDRGNQRSKRKLFDKQ